MALSPTADAAVPPLDAGFLLEQIVADLHWAALQFGAFVHMTARAARPESRQNLRAFRHLVHDDARVMRLALRYAGKAGIAAPTAERADRLYGEMAAHYGRAASFVAAATPTTEQRDSLRRLLPGLRETARAVAEVLGAMEPDARERLDPVYLRDSATLRDFLALAAREGDGGEDAPSVAGPPQLEQRRHAPRAARRVRCRLTFSDGEAEGFIFDISREGLGVQCDAPLVETEAVSVSVGGRRLDATVTRRRRDQLGLTLKRPLPLADPLLTAG